MSCPLKIIAMVQARMGSTRLPGKVLKLLNGQPVLQQIIRRLQKVANLSEIIIVTSNLAQDDPIEMLCQQMGIGCYRGSESNVFARYLDAINQYQAELIIRITGDCPLVSPEIIEEMISEYRPEIDYLSNCHPIRTVPVGLDVEIFSAKSFRQIASQITEQYDLEHVTPFYYRHPENFNLATHTFKQLKLDIEQRLTLDTAADLEVISEIYQRMANKEFFTLVEIVETYQKLAK